MTAMDEYNRALDRLALLHHYADQLKDGNRAAQPRKARRVPCERDKAETCGDPIYCLIHGCQL